MFDRPHATAHVLREIGGASCPLPLFERLRRGAGSWLLDSALRSTRLGRFSFLGSDPALVVRCRGDAIEIDARRPFGGVGPGRHRVTGPLLPLLRALQPVPPDADAALPFIGGAVGYFGYELAAQLDDVRLVARDELGLPDAVWLGVDRLVALDHDSGRAFVSTLGFAPRRREAQRAADDAADALEASLCGGATPAERAPRAGAPPSTAARSFDAGAFAKGVDELLESIAAGDVYQACLTGRVERPFEGDPFDLYRALRRINPAPFASFLELPGVAIVGSSPERFLRLGPDRRVESRPIKGTRPRGRDARHDAVIAAELWRAAKDRAENLMIVDLVRNDLGRVCETGSIHVPELMAIEAYASVFQLVSTVCGRLRPDRDVFDLVAACFPPGSMTGAPKIAAMRRLDRLEPVRRGIYSGALGYLDARGGADLSVVIRSAFVRGGVAVLHAGGGIVADSDPAAEVREARDKLAPLEAALDAARR